VTAAAAWPMVWATNMADNSDTERVRRTLRGDTEAFSELVNLHQHAVYNLAYRFMRDATLAEDMAQETFLKAFRLLKGFRGDCAFSTWLYRVTCSVCLTELKRQRRRAEAPLTPTQGEAARATHQPSLEQAETAERIRRCVTKLPERYATVVTLYYFQGVSYDEIAEIMKIPLGTLKTWMHRARNQLRKLVEEELHPDGRN